ncbi:unnamed protein product, partial [Phaeothamnion confervicola]
EDPRAAILKAALGKVEQFGWTEAALAAGAKDCGYPTVTAGMFKNGTMDLITYMMSEALEETRREMAERTPAAAPQSDGSVSGGSSGCDGMEEDFDIYSGAASVERLTLATELRLMALAPYIRAWPQAMSVGLQPPNVRVTAHALACLADELAFLGGDRSTDMVWYSRRALIAAVYVSGELFMLTDTSRDFADTR